MLSQSAIITPFCLLMDVTSQHHRGSLVKVFKRVSFKKLIPTCQISEIVNHHPQSLVPNLAQVSSEEPTESSTGQSALAGAFGFYLPQSSP